MFYYILFSLEPVQVGKAEQKCIEQKFPNLSFSFHFHQSIRLLHIVEERTVQSYPGNAVTLNFFQNLSGFF